jgi:predicted nucleic acid-binding protein
LRALFDVNVLIALLDGAHQHHALAWDWLDANIAHFAHRDRSFRFNVTGFY